MAQPAKFPAVSRQNKFQYSKRSNVQTVAYYCFLLFFIVFYCLQVLQHNTMYKFLNTMGQIYACGALELHGNYTLAQLEYFK